MVATATQGDDVIDQQTNRVRAAIMAAMAVAFEDCTANLLPLLSAHAEDGAGLPVGDQISSRDEFVDCGVDSIPSFLSLANDAGNGNAAMHLSLDEEVDALRPIRHVWIGDEFINRPLSPYQCASGWHFPSFPIPTITALWYDTGSQEARQAKTEI